MENERSENDYTKLPEPQSSVRQYPTPDDMHNEPMLQWFNYEHLPANLQEISKPFGELARHIVATLRRNPERTVALRKLLESKDCAVRAQIDSL